jgi:hypothetical protein
MMLSFIGLIAGIYVFIMGFVHLKRAKKLVRDSVIIKGTIVDLKKETIRQGTNKIYTFIPIIEYVDEKDSVIKRFESHTGYIEGKYSIGDILEIRYNSNGEKTELLINNWFSKWGVPTGAICIGGIFIIICGLVLNEHYNLINL